MAKKKKKDKMRAKLKRENKKQKKAIKRQSEIKQSEEDLFDHQEMVLFMNEESINRSIKDYKDRVKNLYSTSRMEMLQKFVAINRSKIFNLTKDEEVDNLTAAYFITYIAETIFDIEYLFSDADSLFEIEIYELIDEAQNILIQPGYVEDFIEPLFSTPLDQIRDIYSKIAIDVLSDDDCERLRDYIEENEYANNCIYDMVLATIFLKDHNLFIKVANLLLNRLDSQNSKLKYTISILNSTLDDLLKVLNTVLAPNYLNFVQSLAFNEDKKVSINAEIDSYFENVDERVKYVAFDLFYLMNCGLIDPRRFLEIAAMLADINNIEAGGDESFS